MSRVPGVRKADLDRAIKALKDAGCTVARVEVRPGGQVDIIPALTGAGQLDELEAWRVKRASGATKRPG